MAFKDLANILRDITKATGDVTGAASYMINKICVELNRKNIADQVDTILANTKKVGTVICSTVVEMTGVDVSDYDLDSLVSVQFVKNTVLGTFEKFISQIEEESKELSKQLEDSAKVLTTLRSKDSESAKECISALNKLVVKFNSVCAESQTVIKSSIKFMKQASIELAGISLARLQVATAKSNEASRELKKGNITKALDNFLSVHQLLADLDYDFTLSMKDYMDSAKIFENVNKAIAKFNSASSAFSQVLNYIIIVNSVYNISSLTKDSEEFKSIIGNLNSKLDQASADMDKEVTLKRLINSSTVEVKFDKLQTIPVESSEQASDTSSSQTSDTTK